MDGPNFLELPTELIIGILAKLAVLDLRNCEATNNRFLSDLIRDSALLQYEAEKELTCIEDTPYSRRTNSLVNRVEHIRLLQRAWMDFSHVFTQTITVDPRAASSLCKFVSGICFMGGVRGPVAGLPDVINYAHVASENLGWEHIEIGRPVVDFVVAIDEHNLMAVVTYTPHRSDDQLLSVDIVLLTFSTGKHHEQTENPVIHVHDVEKSRNVPRTTIDIAGKHLLLELVYEDEGKDLNLLHIFDWVSGVPQMDPFAISNLGSAFLAEDTVLLPNGEGNALDIYRIPQTGQAAMIHSFHLPPLTPSCSIAAIVCEVSPSCSGSNSHTVPGDRRRYSSDFEKSLMVISFDITGTDEDNIDRFLFVFLRDEFVDMLNNRRKTSHSSTEWPLWGPLLTRWINTATIGSGTFCNMSYGRRFVWVPFGTVDLHPPIIVLDFNPHAMALAEDNNGCCPTAVMRVVRRTQVTYTRHHAFTGVVESTLPYVETVSADDFLYHRVAINEDTILGFKMSDPHEFAVRSIDVLLIGPV
ncbi:hypothetical protein C8R47DRAFT_1197301 [Mycena vitilis]|nr:hypothetical protein C8R47DRAFT_1197301 [Mycena vitilis]